MKLRFVCRLILGALMLSFLQPALINAQDLGLKLMGTAVSDDPRQSYAVIETQSSGQQKSYREGDQVGENLIKKILLGKVMIQTPKGEALLSIRGGESTATVSPPRPTTGINRKEVDSALPDYSRLMEQINVRPQFEAGRPNGFVIYNIEPGGIFSRMGLRDGDVIEGMNGSNFTTTQPVLKFYEAMKEGGIISLDINRDDKTQKLLFEIH